MKKIGTKRFEIEYPSRLDSKGIAWLKSKPFGGNDLGESSRNFRDFATILYLLQIYQVAKKQKILELGSGPGWLGIFLEKMGFRVTGFDISPAMVSVAKKRAEDENSSAKFQTCDIEDFMQSEENQNSAILIYDALHHCPNERKVLKNAWRYLKKDGILILAEPNKIHEKDQEGIEVAKKYGVLERGLDPKNLQKVLKRLGFTQVWRFHASGQSFLPRDESLIDTLKMIFYPALARFYFGRFKTRVWVVAKK